MARSYAMLAVVLGLIAIHAIVYGRFVAAVSQSRRTARIHDLPDWMPAQAERVWGRASRFILGGALVAVASGLLALRSDSLWSLAAASFAVGFNVVAFLVEYAGFVSLRRILAEIRARADRPREASAPPPHDPEPMSI